MTTSFDKNALSLIQIAPIYTKNNNYIGHFQLVFIAVALFMVIFINAMYFAI